MDSETRNGISVRFDAEAYDLGVLQKAAMKFTEFCAFNFRLESNNQIAVEISFPFSVVPDAEQLLGQYQNEVLDQSLRARIAEETETERNLILAYAFSNTKLVSD
jgi:His-Xaa-Ser system protein HxsD